MRQGIAAYVPATPKYMQQWLTAAKETGNEGDGATQRDRQCTKLKLKFFVSLNVPGPDFPQTLPESQNPLYLLSDLSVLTKTFLR